MKQILLGTTALVAAGLVASNAHAAQGVQLGIGGYYAAAAGFLFDQDDSNDDPGAHTRNVVFRQDVEVHFKGETTLDNGLTVGARIELEGQQSNDQIDEVWAYFKGGWGQIRFGDDDDASEQLHYLIPNASNDFGVDTPYFEFANNHAGFTNGVFQTNSTVLNISSDSTKIIYFSPTFAGFNFAISFAPDQVQDGYSYYTGGGGTNFTNVTGRTQNIASAALNYEHDFNGIGLATGIGGSEAQWSQTGGTTNVQTTWGVDGHVIVTYAGFTLGGAGRYQNNWLTASGADLWVAGVGGTYNWDAWTVGLAWSHGNYEYQVGNSADKIDIIQITGRYDLGPGISIDGMLGYNHMDGGAASLNSDGTVNNHNDNNTWEAGVGFFIGF
jgi:hypothetical protein